MNGYVKNKLFVWAHAMKRAIGPGARIPLDELYKDYGKKHDLAEGEEFVNWLRTVKLRNTEAWEVVFNGNEAESIEEEPKEQEPKEEIERTPDEGREMNSLIKELTVRDVVQLSVRRGRDILPKIMDLNLLKYALQEANQLAGKDTLCRMLRKRIGELQISR
jgi:hypothetical protein